MFSVQNTRAVFTAFIFFLATTVSQATELSLNVHFANADEVVSAIGSGDAELAKAMLADQAYVEEAAIERKFSDKEMWKRAASDLIAGNARENADINGYALALLLRQIGQSGDNERIGLPFANLYDLGIYFRHAGEPDLSELFLRFDYWAEPSEAAANTIWKKLGPTEYHSRLSVIFHEEADGFLNALANFERHLKGVSDYLNEEQTVEAQLFAEGARKASTAEWTEYAKTNTDEGDTPEQLVERMVASTMEDPYQYYQNIEAASYELEKMRGWLRRAGSSKQDIFVFYYSY